MGIYLNSGNSGFERIRKGDYVDKTGLISLINRSIDTPDNLICISRPRRFGKSFAAQMLCAYYDHSCDSHRLFDDLTIAKSSDYEQHLNKYHVIYLDISGFLSDIKKNEGDIGDAPIYITQAVEEEVKSIYPELSASSSLLTTLTECVNLTGCKFIFIIDEWDAVIREAKDNVRAQERYLNLLRGWFKNGNFTPGVVAAAYMTGILPIKKDGSQSAISDFKEYSILDPGGFAEYTGFTEDEVRKLCEDNHMSFESAAKWYDGYSFHHVYSVYNPYSVMSAMHNKRFRSYWKKTSAAEALLTYIDMNQDGLQEDIIKLIDGESIEVDTEGFDNDFETFNSKDDVLTLLVHLGYLTYEEALDADSDLAETETGVVRIPNEEIRIEFTKMLRKGQHNTLVQLIRTSDQLLKDTIAGKEQKVVEAIETVRDSEYAPAYYNDEQALRYVIKFAYITCVDQYSRIEEMPSGHGIADVVFVPKKKSPLPAMIIELKWNKTADAAISQIKDRNYPAALKNYGGDIILVGVNYNDKTKQHTCIIEKM